MYTVVHAFNVSFAYIFLFICTSLFTYYFWFLPYGFTSWAILLCYACMGYFPWVRGHPSTYTMRTAEWQLCVIFGSTCTAPHPASRRMCIHGIQARTPVSASFPLSGCSDPLVFIVQHYPLYILYSTNYFFRSIFSRVIARIIYLFLLCSQNMSITCGSVFFFSDCTTSLPSSDNVTTLRQHTYLSKVWGYHSDLPTSWDSASIERAIE